MTDSQKNLCINNLELVHWIIRRKFSYLLYSNYSDIYDELYSEGCLALCSAVQRFDPDQGFKFSTYATIYIEGYLHRFANEKLPIIKLPRKFRDLKYQIYRYDAIDTPDELICEALDISQNDLYMIRHLSTISRSLNELVKNRNDDSVIEIADLLADECLDFEEFESEESLLMSLKLTCDSLKSISRFVYEDWFLSKLYGDDLTQENLARKYNISQSHVSRILRKGHKKFIEFYLDLK